MRYSVIVWRTATGTGQRVLFNGETTKALAIGRAKLYGDATTERGISIGVFRGKRIGRQIYRLEK